MSLIKTPVQLPGPGITPTRHTKQAQYASQASCCEGALVLLEMPLCFAPGCCLEVVSC